LTLNEAKRGSNIKIVSITDIPNSEQLIRMGISKGTIITCYEKLPKGPIIIKYKHQEIAIGRRLAKKIIVEVNDGTC
jgi:Fe2+ transport system protein FeoA